VANPTVPITGGCLCGAVRYESAAPPIAGFYCHCTMCQKNYGGLFQATVKFAGSTFAFSKAEPIYYRSSAFARRGFCAQCGSPIVFLYDGNQNVWVLFGSLDHPEDWPLTRTRLGVERSTSASSQRCHGMRSTTACTRRQASRLCRERLPLNTLPKVDKPNEAHRTTFRFTMPSPPVLLEGIAKALTSQRLAADFRNGVRPSLPNII
jgi:hypothetical protein